MSKKELTCIGCPIGCALSVDFDDDKKIVLSVSGNNCKIGERYAHKELTNPTRIVTSSIKVINGDLAMVSVKTKEDIPKDKIFDIMKEIHNARVEAPISIGDVLISNVAGTNVDIVATKNIYSLENIEEAKDNKAV
jgi:CxxC motif-containing protein